MDPVSDWPNEGIYIKMRQYMYDQMSNLFQFYLNISEITDKNSTTFKYELNRFACIYKNYNAITFSTQFPYYSKCDCIWDIMYIMAGKCEFLNRFGGDTCYIDYCSKIFSAYCRSYSISTKLELYKTLVSELPDWINRSHKIEDTIIIALGMSLNENISDLFTRCSHMEFYKKFIWETLTEYNFNFDKYGSVQLSWDSLTPIDIEIVSTDEYEQLYYESIITRLYYDINNIKFEKNKKNKLPYNVKELVDHYTNSLHDPRNHELYSSCIIPILERFDVTDKWQILDIVKSELSLQYPDKFKPYLKIMKSLNHSTRHYFVQYLIKTILSTHLTPDLFGLMFISGIRIPRDPVGYVELSELTGLATIAELSGYNLRDYPICILNSLVEKPSEPIHEIYKKITHRYNGTHTKPAARY